MLFNIEINGQQVSAKRGETILTILNRNGIKVPTLCFLSKFSPTGACRMCVVEVDGQSELVPACSYMAEEWMKIKTHSPRVLKARKTLVELLLSSHPDDCQYCDRNNICELQALSNELNINQRMYHTKRSFIQIDKSCPSIERDPSKCILCGRCIRVCDETIGVSAIEIIGRGTKSRIGTSQNKGLNTSSCVKCGQCIMVCPTNALSEKSHIQSVLDALNNSSLYPVVQFSPAVAVSIGEDFGLKSSKDGPGLLKTALKKMGFRQVFDTAFATDISIIEQAAEFVDRLSKNESLPYFTSSCPSWVKYIETFHPGFLPNLSQVKSPQQIMGTTIKQFISRSAGLKPENVHVVSIMPCTSRKYEAENDTIPGTGVKYVDSVITTRELVRLIHMLGIDFINLEPEPAETAFSIGSSPGKMADVAGGSMEGLLRSIYPLLTGQEMGNLKISELRGLKGIKEIRLKAGKQILNVAAVSGLGNVKSLLDEIEAGRNDLHIVEIMACPYGCINGGGQRIGSDEKQLKSRMKVLYDTDDDEMIRTSHKNPVALDLYNKFLGNPFCEQNQKYLYCIHPQSEIT